MHEQWYYAVGSEQRGPVAAEAIREMIQRSHLSPEALVWRDGLSDWVPASTLPEFQPAAIPPPAAAQPAWTPPPPTAGEPQPSYVNYQTPPTEQGGGLAVASLVLGIISIPGACLACLGLILGILAIIFGVMNKNPAHAGQAKAGLICGIIGVVLSVGSGIFGVIAQMGRL
ncbi:MAG TPA: GYF domain-containing protein [Tepidisphaeraceae bacterium]|nr:GYF domain-containing protein [Tepidisphaeraceae bacterium]